MVNLNSMSYEGLWKNFGKLIYKNRLSHAYLFFGGNENDREIKFLFAMSLANFLERKVFEPPSKPLNELLAMRRNEAGAIGIDEVRSIKHFLYQQPVFSRYRIVIIREAENLTPEAQSAILKIVEEPPEATLIILIARNENGLFPALSSRLQKIYFPDRVTEIVQSGGSPQAPDRKELKKSVRWSDLSLDEIIKDNKIDNFFELLLADLSKEPVKNCEQLKEVLCRLTLIKQFNTNKRLQLRVLGARLRN